MAWRPGQAKRYWVGSKLHIENSAVNLWYETLIPARQTDLSCDFGERWFRITIWHNQTVADAPSKEVPKPGLFLQRNNQVTLTNDYVYLHFAVPLVIPLVPIAAYPVFCLCKATVRTRRFFGHICTDCKYDLTGNLSGICPECGTKIQRRPDVPPIVRDLFFAAVPYLLEFVLCSAFLSCLVVRSIQFRFYHDPTRPLAYSYANPESLEVFDWVLRFPRMSLHTHEVSLPNCVPPMIFSTPLLMLLAWRRFRRLQCSRVGTCAYCGYNLIGNVSGVGPECGTSIRTQSASDGRL